MKTRNKRIALNVIGLLALVLSARHFFLEYFSGMMWNPAIVLDAHILGNGALAFAGAIALVVSSCFKDLDK